MKKVILTLGVLALIGSLTVANKDYIGNRIALARVNSQLADLNDESKNMEETNRYYHSIGEHSAIKESDWDNIKANKTRLIANRKLILKKLGK